MAAASLDTYRFWVRAGLAAWAVLALVFAFTDETISEALIDQESWWADFLERYGQIPGALVGIAGAAVLLRLPGRDNSERPTQSTAGIVLVMAFYSLAIATDVGGVQHGDDFNEAIAGGTFALVLVAAIVVPRLLPAEFFERFRPVARLAVALPVIAAVLTVWAIKIPWGRWTPRDILAADDPGMFSPWYIPQGINGHFAFVSGHTAFSFVVLPFVYLFTKTRRSFNIALVAALAWGVLGGLSRIVIGAHAASDALFAAGFTILWFVFLSKRYGTDRLVPTE